MTLTDALDALVVEHDRIGSPLRATLAPGPSRDQVIATIEGLGLRAPSELVDLFSWGEPRPLPGGRVVDWLWPAVPYRLNEAVDWYRTAVRIGGATRAEVEEAIRTLPETGTLTGFWEVDWFPILGGDDSYAADCGNADGGGERCPVWRVNWHPDESYPSARLSASITEFVERILELFRAGAYRWDPQARSIVPVDAVFASRGLGFLLRPWP